MNSFHHEPRREARFVRGYLDLIRESDDVKPRQSLSALEIDELHGKLTRRLGDTSVPTLPQVAIRVIELVSDPNSSINQFAEVIKTDQALTGRLLRVANSAAFAQRGPVTKLERAMVLLGMDRLKAMALGFHLSQAAGKGADNEAKQLWSQSLFRGWAAHRIAEQVCRPVAGEAFIVGLMLDCGTPMMEKLVGASYGRWVNRADAPQKQYATEFRELEFTHVDVAVALCRMWKLPDVLLTPIAFHHSLPDAPNRNDPLSVLRAIAFFVGSLRLDAHGLPQDAAPRKSTARDLFALNPGDLETIFKQAAEDYKASRELFSSILPQDLSVDSILDRANDHLNEAVEDLVEESAEAADRAVAKFEAAGLVLELEAATEGRITVFITDTDGNRLASEQVCPDAQSPDEIRSLLLLDNADDETMSRLVVSMNGLLTAA